MVSDNSAVKAFESPAKMLVLVLVLVLGATVGFIAYKHGEQQIHFLREFLRTHSLAR